MVIEPTIRERGSMTATAILPVPDTARLTAASAMQKLLPELVALALDAKQAHWNMTGRAFLALHMLTDEIAADTRTWVDRVAERAVALGFPVDARPRTVAAVGGLFPAGWVSDDEVIAELIDRIDDVVATARASLADVEHADAVAHDLTVTVLEGLEKYRWMLRAQIG
jgi:starvation-inducible DNA-binding protein